MSPAWWSTDDVTWPWGPNVQAAHTVLYPAAGTAFPWKLAPPPEDSCSSMLLRTLARLTVFISARFRVELALGPLRSWENHSIGGQRRERGVLISRGSCNPHGSPSLSVAACHPRRPNTAWSHCRPRHTPRPKAYLYMVQSISRRDPMTARACLFRSHAPSVFKTPPAVVISLFRAHRWLLQLCRS